MAVLLLLPGLFFAGEADLGPATRATARPPDMLLVRALSRAAAVLSDEFVCGKRRLCPHTTSCCGGYALLDACLRRMAELKNSRKCDL